MEVNYLTEKIVVNFGSSKNTKDGMSIFNICSSLSYLPGGSHPLPDTKVADDPSKKKAQRKLPLDLSQDLNARRYV